MPRLLLSAAGTAPRRRHVWVFLGSACAAASVAIIFLSRGGWGSGWPWDSLAVAVALLLAHAAAFVLTNRTDALVISSDEAIIVAALLVTPDDFAIAVLLAAFLYPSIQRVLGVTQRMRRPSAEKVVFNAASQILIGAGALLTFDLALAAGTGRIAAALLGALSSWGISSALVLGVIRAARGEPSAPGETRDSMLRSLRTSLAAALVGVLIGLAASTVTAPAVFVLGSAGLLYVAARSLARQAIHVETAERLLEVAPHVLAPGDVDTQIIDHARRLLGCASGAITTSPPADPGALAVPIVGSGEAAEYLTVDGRLGTHRSFEREDRELLEGLAALAGPARQQQQLVNALERSEASRGAILGALAHDLRSPIAVSSSALQTLATLLARMDAPTAQSLVMAADRSNARALRILDELLALEHAALSPGATGQSDPAVAAEQVRDTYGELVEVRGGPPLALAVDVRAVCRIMDNLVANAIKHAPGASIHIAWEEEDGDRALLTVDDDGAGIPEDLRAELTGPFRQRDGNTDGVGLGLYLAQRFAELAGGHLEIGESPSGGASMRVFLPIAADAGAGQPATTGR